MEDDSSQRNAKQGSKRKREERKGPPEWVLASPTVESVGDLKINMPGLIILVSKPGGGKSYMIRYLMYCNQKLFSHCIAFSKSAFRPGNLEYIPDYEGTPEDKKRYMNFKWMMYKDEVLREFLNGQQAYPEEARPLGVIIIDDDISDPHMFESPAMIDAITMYRHYKIVIIVAAQYVNKLSTTMRECASQVGLFKMDSKRSIEAAYESYGQEFEDHKEFKQWLFAATYPPSEHKCCWKDKMNDKPWEIVRAPDHIPKFRLEYGERASKPAKKKHKSKAKKHKSMIFGNYADQVAEMIKEAPKNPYADSLGGFTFGKKKSKKTKSKDKPKGGGQNLTALSSSTPTVEQQ